MAFNPRLQQQEPEETPPTPPKGSPVVARKEGDKTVLLEWPQAGYSQLIEIANTVRSIDSKLGFFQFILILVIIAQVILFVLNFITS